MRNINQSRFFFEWKGHQIEDISSFHAITTTQRPNELIVYIAGDSSLDNKYWVKSDNELQVEIPEIHKYTLDRPEPKPDVAFWMNYLFGIRATCINTAVEESMLRERDHDLLPNDNIRSQDVLIVSVGANDIALNPLPRTICHMLQLAWVTPLSSLKSGTARSLKYFRNVFGSSVQDYIYRMTAKTRPRVIIVCMIYFPHESGLGQQSWADMQLKALGYSIWPRQLQTAIRTLCIMATRNIKIEGTEILPCALHDVLDGKIVKDYAARVEPNENGGRKMAEKLVELLSGVLGAPLLESCDSAE